MTERQLLWRVELPLSIPEIIAGLRIATVSTVAIATLVFLANARRLGTAIYQQIDFKTNILLAGGLSILMALVLDLMLLLLAAPGRAMANRGGKPHDRRTRIPRRLRRRDRLHLPPAGRRGSPAGGWWVGSIRSGS